MSHIGDHPRKVLILASQGRPDFYTVDPLVETAPPAQPEPVDRAEAAIAAYARAGVTVPMLEARVARAREEWDDANLADLEALYRALVAKETTKEAEFDLTIGADA
jgi:hypothetical protein